MQYPIALRCLWGLFLVLAVATVTLGQETPVAVSPAGPTAITVDQRCPTFIWGAAPGADSFEVAVYAADDVNGPVLDPVLSVSIPGSAQAWVPPAERCLEPGSRYAWTVRAVGERGPSEWSVPSVFSVSALPSDTEIRAALETLTRHLDAEYSDAELPAPAEPSVPVTIAPAPASELAVTGTREEREGGIGGISSTFYSFASPWPGTYMVPGNSFISAADTSADSAGRSIHGYAWVSFGDGSPFVVNYVKDVHLPATATVTAFSCRYQDNSATGGITADVQLRVRTDDAATSLSMAEVNISTTPADQSTEILSELDTTIEHPLVLNSINHYFVFAPWSQSVAGSNLRFYGCRISYVMDFLLP